MMLTYVTRSMVGVVTATSTRIMVALMPCTSHVDRTAPVASCLPLIGHPMPPKSLRHPRTMPNQLDTKQMVQVVTLTVSTAMVDSLIRTSRSPLTHALPSKIVCVDTVKIATIWKGGINACFAKNTSAISSSTSECSKQPISSRMRKAGILL